ncbi:transcription initiation factor TFIID subunit 3 isoform X1 [Erinaceus europaeus]|uniref:Transcription initiation factor TFIID subunit 3 isoform X1 n=2 Tax=Erinaceus europaeus TaxID=9365 RepID=A0ABM3XH20_ERIEU|nr:transcription initiation factor TFIID subunit 3 isoform X1 [Erinaceus europaeus]
MCESYSRSLLRVSVAQICQALGWDSVQLSACHLLTDVLQRYLQQLGRGCHRYSELYGRTDPILDDVSEAFQLMGVSLHELEDYIHNIEPVTFPHQIPSFPVSKNNVLQFPQPGSKDAEERKEYIPDYMPPIVSSQEEEEEEQVPTDGGTSAEAMQVPLEEDDELEEEEIINDENFLGKRPLDSPESEELLPPMKRPRILSMKGDALDVVLLEAREPLSSINTQKIPPMLSPVHVQDSTDLVPPSPEPPMLAPVAKSQLPTAKPLDAKSFTPKTKTKSSSPGQKTKSPKTAPSPAMVGSPIHSPKTISKEKKSPGRSKSPKSPKSPKVMSHIPPAPVRPETPNRTPSITVSEKGSKEIIQVKQIQTPPEAGKLNNENLPRKAVVMDKTIDDSIDAVIARACAEREPDPFEFSSGSESEGDIFTSPKRISGSECITPKASTSSNNFTKSGSTPLPLSGGTSSSDNSWTMDASIDEVVRKAKLGTPANVPPNFPYLSSPSVSPPTPEPLPKVYEEKSKQPLSMEVKKKLKKELKTKMKKKEKQRDKEREREKSKEKSKDKERLKEREKEKEASKESKHPWKDFLKDEETDPYKFKIKEFDDVDAKVRLKDGLVRREKEKHKDKKKDREKGKKDKDRRDKEKVKDRGREEKMRVPPAPLVLPPKEMALPLFSPAGAMRVPSMLPSLSPMLPEKLFEEKEKPKEKERKKDRKEKKKKKEKEKEKKEKEREKEKREREKREKEKEKHKHEKVSSLSFSALSEHSPLDKIQIKVEPVVPAPSPVIPRLTLRVGAGQDKIVISKVVPAPEAKPAPALSRPKTPPPAPLPPPAPMHVNPAPLPLHSPLLAPPSASPALLPSVSPAISGAGSRAPVRSVITETVSTYVIRDEWGNQIWICPGCNKPDDGSPMIGCDDCDDWYHWPCVGITAAPPEEMQWFCPKCANKKKDKKHKKRKHRAH